MEQPFSALKNLKVLVIEDETMIVMMIEDMLEEFGCIVEVASSISKALETLHMKLPDGVLLDMNIQGRKPVAVAEELVDRSVPFLLVTGYAPGDSDPPIFKVAPRLQKPFNKKELGRRMLEVFLGGANAARPLKVGRGHAER